jgi:hypothetical protein
MSRVGLFVGTMSVYQEIYVRHQQGDSSAQRTQILGFGSRCEVRRLVRDAAPTLPEGHHLERSCGRPLGGEVAPEIFAQRILNQAAKRDSRSRRGRLGPPEYVIVKLDRGPHKDDHKDA